MQRIAQPHLPPQLTPANDILTLLGYDESLSGLLIQNQDMSGIRANGASISESKFDKVLLAEAHMEKLLLTDSMLTHGTLTATDCTDAAWRRVMLDNMRCSGLRLPTSTLKDVVFTDCKLDFVNFRFSNLKNVLFKDCILDEADFYRATLEQVVFHNCSFEKAQFSSAVCKAVDLRSSVIANIHGLAGLAGATIDSVQLITIAHDLAQQLNIRVADD